MYQQFNMVDILLLWFSFFRGVDILNLLFPKPERKAQSYQRIHLFLFSWLCPEPLSGSEYNSACQKVTENSFWMLKF